MEIAMMAERKKKTIKLKKISLSGIICLMIFLTITINGCIDTQKESVNLGVGTSITSVTTIITTTTTITSTTTTVPKPTTTTATTKTTTTTKTTKTTTTTINSKIAPYIDQGYRELILRFHFDCPNCYAVVDWALGRNKYIKKYFLSSRKTWTIIYDPKHTDIDYIQKHNGGYDTTVISDKEI